MIALLITAAAAAATPTLEINPRSFSKDGVRASYTRTVEQDGTVHLRGHYKDRSRTPFHFQVEGKVVTGNVGGTTTVFPRPKS